MVIFIYGYGADPYCCPRSQRGSDPVVIIVGRREGCQDGIQSSGHEFLIVPLPIGSLVHRAGVDWPCVQSVSA